LDNPFLKAFENGFGETLAFAGDVDGDGDDELLVAAPYWDSGDRGGRVALYRGSPRGLQRTPVVVDGPTGSFMFGLTLGSAGDIDADGFDDVVVGSSRAAYVFYGSARGLGAPVEFPLPERALYGASVSGAGDVNGDGFDDVVIGAGDWDGQYRNQGRVYVHLGSSDGLRLTSQKLSGGQRAGARFGNAVAAAGDVNRDGFDDILVGAPNWRNGEGVSEGRAFVYLGSSTGMRLPAFHFDPINLRRSGFGASLAPAGDVNRDGFDDILLGVPGWSSGGNRIYVYLGSRLGPTRPPITRRAPDSLGFGSAVSGAGDLNRDGFDDILVGAPGANSERYSEGRTHIFQGTRAGLTQRAFTRDPTDKKNAQYGDHFAGGGDVNGDGTTDIAVAAPEYPVELYRGRVYVYY
jgi:hypothetical protein